MPRIEKIKEVFCLNLLVMISGVLVLSCSAVPSRSLDEILAQDSGTILPLTPWESNFLNTGGLPAAPIPQYLTAPDGLALAYRDWIPSGWSGTGEMVLFVPGSTSHSAHYSVIGESLAANGTYARIIDVRGMGLSVRKSATSSVNDFTPRTFTDDSQYYVGRLGDSLDENQIIRDLSFHIRSLRQVFPSARLILGGHSSGGGIVSRYVEANGDFFLDGIILCGPFNHHYQPQNRGLGTRGGTYANLHMGALGDALRGDIHRYVIGFNLGDLPGLELSVREYTYTTMTGSETKDPQGFLLAYTKPLLWIHGEKDTLFDPVISEQQFLKIQNASAKSLFKVIPDTSHIGLTWSTSVGQTMAQWAAGL